MKLFHAQSKPNDKSLIDKMSVKELRAKLEAHGLSVHGLKEALISRYKGVLEDDPELPADREFVLAMKAILDFFGINVQRYWNGTLVGPDCRKFCDHFVAIFARIRALYIAKNENMGRLIELDQFAANIKQIGIINKLTRSVEMLTSEQLDELELACKEFGVTCRKFKKTLTMKGHIIEQHVMRHARKYANCGCFSEECLEAYHPKDTEYRIRCRKIRNADDRLEAMYAVRLEEKHVSIDDDRAAAGVIKTRRTQEKRDREILEEGLI